MKPVPKSNKQTTTRVLQQTTTGRKIPRSSRKTLFADRLVNFKTKSSNIYHTPPDSRREENKLMKKRLVYGC